ncbi:MAG: Smr/MutS family protein [Rhizomicrobium sp.]|jgi:DNA-nicking Smr family endonuclease
MRKRSPSSEERELFESVLQDAKPLKGRTRAPAKPKPEQPVAIATAPQQKLELPPPRRRSGPTGLDGRTAERLKRGDLEPAAKLDLHGLTEAAAHRTLVTFIKGAHARGVRLALVVTGKGGREEPADAPFDLELAGRARGVLKAMTPRWLKERDLVDLVADVRTAHRKHGGAGALYVYLRKRTP